MLKVVALFQDGLNTSGETDNDIPKFITDSNEKTSYVRGKFLGKVSCWLDIASPGCGGARVLVAGLAPVKVVYPLYIECGLPTLGTVMGGGRAANCSMTHCHNTQTLVLRGGSNNTTTTATTTTLTNPALDLIRYLQVHIYCIYSANASN